MFWRNTENKIIMSTPFREICTVVSILFYHSRERKVAALNVTHFPRIPSPAEVRYLVDPSQDRPMDFNRAILVCCNPKFVFLWCLDLIVLHCYKPFHKMALLKTCKKTTKPTKWGNFVGLLISESTLNLKARLLFSCLARVIYSLTFNSHKKRPMWKIKTAQRMPHNRIATAQALSSPPTICN